MESYRDLKVWQNSMMLAERVYAATADFPAAERYSMVQQMRRAAVSISSNIAGGYGRRSAKQRYNFLENALGSLFELETQVELSTRLGFLPTPSFVELSDAIRGLGRGITALMRYVHDEAKNERNRYAPLRGTPRNSEEPEEL